jgi:hypothetical protein
VVEVLEEVEAEALVEDLLGVLMVNASVLIVDFESLINWPFLVLQKNAQNVKHQ